MGIGFRGIGGGTVIISFPALEYRVFVCAWDDRAEGRQGVFPRIVWLVFGLGSAAWICPLDAVDP
jgi:hypothetical protein